MNNERDENADMVATLIQAAGRREDTPSEAYESVFAVVESAWRDKVRRRRYRQLAGGFAAAAALAIFAIALIPAQWRGSPMATEVATTDRLLGLVESLPAGAASWQPIDTLKSSLLTGTRIRTGREGRAGLILADDVSLRLASNTEIELTNVGRIQLLRGSVYADTGPGETGHLTVDTSYGTARDYGTQFEVRLGKESLRLRVREGRVALSIDDEQVWAGAGEQLMIGQGGQELQRIPIALDDLEWRWTESVAPSPKVDNLAVRELLDWVSRETGRRVVYADASLAERAASTVLHGRVENLQPLEVLQVMLSTTDFRYEIAPDGTIEVGRK